MIDILLAADLVNLMNCCRHCYLRDKKLRSFRIASDTTEWFVLDLFPDLQREDSQGG